MKQANLFLNGDFCDYSKIINRTLFTLVADGGYNNCLKNQIKPDLIIGDLDSLDQTKVQTGDLKLIQKDDNQDTTDFQKCLFWLRKNGFQKINVYSFDGERIDHMLAGFSAIIEFADLEIRLFTKKQSIQRLPKEFKTEAKIGELFSIFPFPIAKNVFYKGLKWELEGQDLEIAKLIGTSNQAAEKEVEIKHSQGNLFLIRNWS